MILEHKLVLAALVRGLPYLVIIVSAFIRAVTRKSIAAGVLAVGCAGVAAKDIWGIFTPILMRAYSVEQYSIINLRFSIGAVAGLYLLSIALGFILLAGGSSKAKRVGGSD